MLSYVIAIRWPFPQSSVILFSIVPWIMLHCIFCAVPDLRKIFASLLARRRAKALWNNQLLASSHKCYTVGKGHIVLSACCRIQSVELSNNWQFRWFAEFPLALTIWIEHDTTHEKVPGINLLGDDSMTWWRTLFYDYGTIEIPATLFAKVVSVLRL